MENITINATMVTFPSNMTSTRQQPRGDTSFIYVVLILLIVQVASVLVCTSVYYKLKAHKLMIENEQKYLNKRVETFF